MRFFDTHCHLDFSEFEHIREQVLVYSRRQGVEKIVVPGVSHDNWSSVLALSAQQPEVLAALGMHPCFMSRHCDEHIEKLSSLLQQHSVVAVGEIGLDFWQGEEDKAEQISLLDQQLYLASMLDLPVILHSRKSHDVVLSRLKKYQIHRGVIHAFSGSWQQAKGFLDQGLKIGLGGSITYPRANKLRGIVAELPLDTIVLETDAPDMPINGRQGAINRPDYLPEIFAELVSLRSESNEALAAALWQNSESLFLPVPLST